MLREFFSSLSWPLTIPTFAPAVSDIPGHVFTGRYAQLPRPLDSYYLIAQVGRHGFQPVHHHGANFMYDPLTKRIAIGVKGKNIYTELTPHELAALAEDFPEQLKTSDSKWELSRTELQHMFNLPPPSPEEIKALELASERRIEEKQERQNLLEARFRQASECVQRLPEDDGSRNVTNVQAIVVPQHMFEVSAGEPIGTGSLWPCHALVIYNPRNYLTAFAHIDKATDTRSIRAMWDSVSDGKPLTVHVLASEGVDTEKVGESLSFLDQLSKEKNVAMNYGQISLDAEEYVFYPRTGTVTREKVRPGLTLANREERDRRFLSPLIPGKFASRLLRREPYVN